MSQGRFHRERALQAVEREIARTARLLALDPEDHGAIAAALAGPAPPPHSPAARLRLLLLGLAHLRGKLREALTVAEH